MKSWLLNKTRTRAESFLSTPIPYRPGVAPHSHMGIPLGQITNQVGSRRLVRRWQLDQRILMMGIDVAISKFSMIVVANAQFA